MGRAQQIPRTYTDHRMSSGWQHSLPGAIQADYQFIKECITALSSHAHAAIANSEVSKISGQINDFADAPRVLCSQNSITGY